MNSSYNSARKEAKFDKLCMTRVEWLSHCYHLFLCLDKTRDPKPEVFIKKICEEISLGTLPLETIEEYSKNVEFYTVEQVIKRLSTIKENFS